MTRGSTDQVSICIPAYNAGKYLPYTLDSLLAQTYRNIEIIVSDNASTDNTREIVQGYMLLDERIRCLTNATNIGYVGNIARVVEAASNDVIAVYHADDVYEPTIVEKELLVLNERQDILAVFTKYQHFEGELREKTTIPEAWESLVPFDTSVLAYYGELDEFARVLLEIGNPFCCPSFMIRKSSYLTLGGFSDKYPAAEDLELWIKYLKNGRALAIVDSALVNYRHSEEQGSAVFGRRLELPVFFKVVDEMLMQSNSVGRASREKYRIRKAFAWIDLAFRVGRSDPRYHDFLKESEKVHRFSILTEMGLLQKYPTTYGWIRSFRLALKRAIKKATPGVYSLMKLIYYKARNAL